jgi:hypothetical protein
MAFAWFEEVTYAEPLTQGDLLSSCPVVRWSDDQQPESPQTQELENLLIAEEVDCIVMSQACDLEHGKIRDVILCPTYTITGYRPLWNAAVEASRQNPTEKRWSRFLNEIRVLRENLADTAILAGLAF